MDIEQQVQEQTAPHAAATVATIITATMIDTDRARLTPPQVVAAVVQVEIKGCVGHKQVR